MSVDRARSEQSREEIGDTIGCIGAVFSAGLLPLFYVWVIAALGDGLARFFRLSLPEPAGLVLCYIFVFAATTASMPLEWNVASMRQAGAAGVAAATHGIRIFLIVLIALALCITMVLNFLTRRYDEQTLIAVIFIAAVLCNLVCMDDLFKSLRRVRPEKKTPVLPAEEIQS